MAPDAQQLDVALIQVSAAILPLDDVVSDDPPPAPTGPAPHAMRATRPLDIRNQSPPLGRVIERLGLLRRRRDPWAQRRQPRWRLRQQPPHRILRRMMS
jgi:hypothetical protein